MNPSVSIIVPVYNARKTIARCIESIINQEFQDFELLLLVSVAEYLIVERENKLIDDLNMHENRAASLSAMNMGVNIVEIAALFLSSMFSLAAVKWCFVLMGSILVIISIYIKSYKWNL